MQVVEGGGQDIRRLEVVTFDNRKESPAPLAGLQIRNMYNALGTGEDEQDPLEGSSEPSAP